MSNDKEIVSLETYKLWAKTIHSMITESFTYYGYLQGLSDFFTKKRRLSIPCMEFIGHLKYLFQSTICLNLSKLFLDNGKDVFSFSRYKHKIESYKGTKLIIKKPKISADLENKIYSFRNNYIAHSIENSSSITIQMESLFELLIDANNYFNLMTDIDVIGVEYRFERETINRWINHCKKGVIECFSLNTL